MKRLTDASVTKRKQVLVIFIITILLINSASALAKEKNAKDNKEKDKNKALESNSKKEDSKDTEKETGSKGENNDQKPESVQEAEKDQTLKPTGLQGPGKGRIDSSQEWSGEVWVHYGYNEDFDQWELGIEGLTEEGDTAWYSFCLVDDEIFFNNKLSISGTFSDEPFNGLDFEYIANINSMKWEISGKGFHFTGKIMESSFEDSNFDQVSMKPEYQAKGTIDAYVDVFSSKIVDGSWQVTLRDDEVDFKAKYVEENLDETIEKSPVGSKDIFWHSFTVESYSFDGEELEFTGILHVEKLWSTLEGSKEKVRWDTSPVTITINSESFFIDRPPAGAGPSVYDQDWDRIGTTKSYKCSNPPSAGNKKTKPNKLGVQENEIELYYGGSITYKYLILEESGNKISYHFTAWVYLDIGDESVEIESVTMITPNGVSYRMIDKGLDPFELLPRYECSIPPLYGPDELGEYRFVARDIYGSETSCSHIVSEWIEVLPDSISPQAGHVFSDSDSIKWDITWGGIPVSFNKYEIGIYAPSDGCIWRIEATELPIEYDGPELTETGSYGFIMFCLTPDMEAEVHITGYFFVNQTP